MTSPLILPLEVREKVCRCWQGIPLPFKRKVGEGSFLIEEEIHSVAGRL